MTFDAIGSVIQITNYLKAVKGYDEADASINIHDSGRVSINVSAHDTFVAGQYDSPTKFRKWESGYLHELSSKLDEINADAVACDSRKVRELKHTQAQLGKLIEDSTKFSAINEELIRAKMEQMREELGSLLLTYEGKADDRFDDQPTSPHYTTMNGTPEYNAPAKDKIHY